MKKTLIALTALATLGLAANAQAKQDPHERAAWQQTVNNATVAGPNAAPVVVEGRNAADVSDSYIRRSVEQDARSTR
ncbi:hypothetical protein MWN34_05710 [Ancylobacter sp. 6x-1]|uniref:DUF4148 domain-containing protein n=1 Tax=Ancylobacter crimeensis TaxID=2579147 RepID=A0ABT0D8Y7_9HYPH|nr:hypothetical protein [Ancylobacter crimeensis]MCK0196407.1 hypothetical protein [Ancylobacter crimeensis]